MDADILDNRALQWALW